MAVLNARGQGMRGSVSNGNQREKETARCDTLWYV
jgi:hypothetical protein